MNADLRDNQCPLKDLPSQSTTPSAIDGNENASNMKKISDIAREASASVSTPAPATKLARPNLPVGSEPLTAVDQWKSILWHIKTAEADGEDALLGLAMAFGKTIQSTALQELLTDVRGTPKAATDLQTLLWDASIPITENGETLHSLQSSSGTQVAISFQDAIVIANPWEPWRLTRSLGNIRRQEWRQDHNHQTELWTPWPILWVHSGNHSITAATILNKGSLRDVHCIDATPVLSAVDTDGENWFRTFDRSVIEPVHSIAMAAIFEIGRRLTGSRAVDLR